MESYDFKETLTRNQFLTGLAALVAASCSTANIVQKEIPNHNLNGIYLAENSSIKDKQLRIVHKRTGEIQFQFSWDDSAQKYVNFIEAKINGSIIRGWMEDIGEGKQEYVGSVADDGASILGGTWMNDRYSPLNFRLLRTNDHLKGKY